MEKMVERPMRLEMTIPFQKKKRKEKAKSTKQANIILTLSITENFTERKIVNKSNIRKVKVINYPRLGQLLEASRKAKCTQ